MGLGAKCISCQLEFFSFSMDIYMQKHSSLEISNINWSSKVRMLKQKFIFVENESTYLHMNV